MNTGGVRGDAGLGEPIGSRGPVHQNARDSTMKKDNQQLQQRVYAIRGQSTLEYVMMLAGALLIISLVAYFLLNNVVAPQTKKLGNQSDQIKDYKKQLQQQSQPSNTPTSTSTPTATPVPTGTPTVTPTTNPTATATTTSTSTPISDPDTTLYLCRVSSTGIPTGYSDMKYLSTSDCGGVGGPTLLGPFGKAYSTAQPNSEPLSQCGFYLEKTTTCNAGTAISRFLGYAPKTPTAGFEAVYSCYKDYDEYFLTFSSTCDNQAGYSSAGVQTYLKRV